MIRLNKIGIIVSILVSWHVYSQSYYNQLYTGSATHGRIALSDNNIFCTGAVYNPSGSGSVTLTKYDLLGQLIIHDTFSIDGIVTAGAHIYLLSNDFYMANIVSDTPPYSSSSWNIQFSKLNTSFIQNWNQTFGGNQTDQPFEIIEKDNFLYIIATTNSFGAGNGDYYVIKTDLSGNIIWEQTYGTSSNELLWGALKTDDGNLILTGVKKITNVDYNLFYIKIDTSGQVIWEREYNYGINDYSGYGITLHDHNFLTYHNLDDGNGGTSVAFVKKLDGNGDLLWSKSFPYNTLSSFTNFSRPIENSDGTIIISNTCENSNGIMINRLIKLDLFGNTLWEKEYFTRPDLPQYIYDIKPTSDSGYIMCGSAFPVDTNIQHAWLVKTNCNGEDGVQHPITGTPCEQYDCTQFPIDANFMVSSLTVDLAIGGVATFENNSSNATSRIWNFGDGNMDYTDSILSHTYTQVGTYEVQLIVFHGMCSDTMTQTIELINTTGVEDLMLETGITIYPNPSNGNFTVKLKNGINGTLKIIDLLGRVHETLVFNKSNLVYPIIGLPQGIYLVEITFVSGRKEVSRVVVE
jgi:hypothetical protein